MISGSNVKEFVYEALPSRVIFGWGATARLADEVERLKLKQILVLSTPAQTGAAQAVAAALGSRVAATFDGAAMHTPVDVTNRAMEIVRANQIDATLAIGGGSTIGLGKAIALRTDLPQIALPTTYAGSEMTPILGQTENGMKTTIRDRRVLPEIVIYDPAHTLSLPAALSATSGLNAIAHAVEGLYAKDGNPIVSLMAEDGIRALAAALPVLVERPADREAREKALYGAWLCGATLGAVGMALHHKLCHVLGGSFDLPHAETHSVILPYAAAYNANAAPEAIRAVERALGTERPAAVALQALAKRIGAPTSLAAIGMKKDGIDKAADLAVANPYWNPRPIDRASIAALIADAFAGKTLA